MLAGLQRVRDGHRHLLLLRPEFEILRMREQSVRREYLLNLFNQILFRSPGLNFNGADHGAISSLTHGPRLSSAAAAPAAEERLTFPGAPRYSGVLRLRTAAVHPLVRCLAGS